jgi:hypothetical protein
LDNDVILELIGIRQYITWRGDKGNMSALIGDNHQQEHCITAQDTTVDIVTVEITSDFRKYTGLELPDLSHPGV